MVNPEHGFMLILDYMEASDVKNLWNYKAGCFYDQTYQTRTRP